jgi:hypothetical protein
MHQLGGDGVSVAEGERLYTQGKMLMKRYDPTVAIDPVSLDATDEFDRKTFIVRSKSGIKGVIAGDVFDRDKVLSDMVRTSSLRGQVGELLADVTKLYQRAKEEADRISKVLFVQVSREIQAGSHGDIKPTKDNVEGIIASKPELMQAINNKIDAENNMIRADKLQDGLFGLENALKKALDHGERSQ